MNYRNPVKSYEYKNDYLFIVIREAPEHGPKTYHYCCGINTTRFDPICWGKAGICSNPAFKGLQLLMADVSATALQQNLETKRVSGLDCSSITPKGDGWYRDNMLITKAMPKNIQKILEFSVFDLVKTVMVVCAPDAKIPEILPNPKKLQQWLDTFNVKDYVAAAPPPIAKPGSN